MKSRASILVVVVMVISMLLAACGQQAATDTPVPPAVVEATAEPTAVPTEVPAAPKQLVIATVVDLVDLDPARAFSDTYLVAGKAMYDTLVELDLDNPGGFLPGLATSWEISDDSTVYTFHLRQGVTFESGREMTAKDVKWSLERLQNLQGNPAWLMDGVESIEAIDDYTVQITMAQSDASLLAKTSVAYTAPMDSVVAEENGCVAGPDAAETDTCKEYMDEHSLGTGPYILERWVRDSEIRLVANPNHWRGAPNFETVIFKQVNDATAQAQLLQRGDADFAMNLDPDTAQTLEGTAGIVLDKELSMSIIYLAMNTRPEVSEYTSNPLFRQAVLYAIDHEGINALLAGFAATPPGILSIGMLGAETVEGYQYNPEKAKELLAEAGLDGGVEIDMHYAGIVQFGVDFNVLAQKVQADLAEVGITINLFPEEFSVWITPYRAGETVFTIGYNTPDYLDPHAVTQVFGLAEGVFAARMAYSNPKADELTMAAVQTADPTARAELYGQLLQVLNDDAVFHVLVQPMEVIGYRDTITSFRRNPVNKLTLWEIDKE